MPHADPAELRNALAIVRADEPTHGVPGYADRIVSWIAACELLAREFVRLLDAGELVRVKVLEWEQDLMGWTAEAPPIGDLHVWSRPKAKQWFLSVGSSGGPCTSGAEGKQLAEAFYRDWMAKGLEPLLAKETPCPACHGRRKVYEQSETGQDYGEWPCPKCCPEGKEAGK